MSPCHLLLHCAECWPRLLLAAPGRPSVSSSGRTGGRESPPWTTCKSQLSSSDPSNFLLLPSTNIQLYWTLDWPYSVLHVDSRTLIELIQLVQNFLIRYNWLIETKKFVSNWCKLTKLVKYLSRYNIVFFLLTYLFPMIVVNMVSQKSSFECFDWIFTNFKVFSNIMNRKWALKTNFIFLFFVTHFTTWLFVRWRPATLRWASTSPSTRERGRPRWSSPGRPPSG